MKIKSYEINNYRSIKSIKIKNTPSINVFFGKNNVGKSNILRALHLGFYVLRDNDIYIPDTFFHNRDSYKPIKIKLNLNLDKQKIPKNFKKDIVENIDYLNSIILTDLFTENGEIPKIEEFINMALSFKPILKLILQISISYNDMENSKIKIILNDEKNIYDFNYTKFKKVYGEVEKILNKKIYREARLMMENMMDNLELKNIKINEKYKNYYLRSLQRVISAPLVNNEYSYIFGKLKSEIRNSSKDKEDYEIALEDVNDVIDKIKNLKEKILFNFSKINNMISDYFISISNHFILISYREFFQRFPLNYKDGEPIEVFNQELFNNKLSNLIESPSLKERGLIEDFVKIFNSSYTDLGELENLQKFRDEVIAIFGSNVISLPMKDQGRGVQDLFLYLSCMILFNSSIVGIEEPEGGLSNENQKKLGSIIKSIYTGSEKQIFITSHSEEFEFPDSYFIEMGKNGTTLISRRNQEEVYEEKIDTVLIKRKLIDEKEAFKTILKDLTDKQMKIQILNYIESLDNNEEINIDDIAKKFKYPKQQIKQVINEIIKRKNAKK